MDAKSYFANDVRTAVSYSNPGELFDLYAKMITKYQTPGGLMGSRFFAGCDARKEFVLLTAANSLALEHDKPRRSDNLADRIMDGQAAKVRQFGEKAFRLSEKQVAIVLKDAYLWIYGYESIK